MGEEGLLTRAGELAMEYLTEECKNRMNTSIYCAERHGWRFARMSHFGVFMYFYTKANRYILIRVEWDGRITH